MAAPLRELEGTWEEIAAHGPELAGRRVRLIVLEPKSTEKSASFRPAKGPSTARSLLKYAGTWEGDDLEERLQEMIANRGTARFGGGNGVG